METMRKSWTDERLDDLNAKVDARGQRVERGFAEMDRRFAEMDRRFAETNGRLDKREARAEARSEAMMDRLYSMQRLMIQFCGTALAALLGLIATQL